MMETVKKVLIIGSVLVSFFSISINTYSNQIEDQNADKATKFARSFFESFEVKNVYGIRELISDDYTGNVGGFSSKTDFMSGIQSFFDSRENINVTYSIGRISYPMDEDTANSGVNVIVLSTSWVSNINGTIENGRTKWWISNDEGDWKLIHAEGDWFF